MFKRDRSEVMPGQMEKIIEAVVDSIEEEDGAGSDLIGYDTSYCTVEEPWIEVVGQLDLAQLIREIVAKWEEVRLP